jgi:hypothetical protein
MLPRNLSDVPPAESHLSRDLAGSLPTIFALAELASAVLASPQPDRPSPRDLSPEAQALLVAASGSGSFAIQSNKAAFEPDKRFLAVSVEQADGTRMEFRVPGNPEQTVRFLEGFRQLCQHGLVMHQVMNEFSLTASGFERARHVAPAAVEELLAMAREES